MSGTLDTLVKLAERIDDARSSTTGFGSLSGYTKNTFIRSRVFVENTLETEPVLPGLTSVLQIVYCGMVLTALRMNQFISTGRTMKELLNVVATEDMREPYVDIAAALEDFSMDARSEEQRQRERQERKDDEKDKRDRENSREINDAGGSEEVERMEGGRVPVGRIIELGITNAEGKEIGKIPITVQLMPYIIHSATLRQLVSNNTKPGFLNRIAQLRAGEISFWRDFVFGVDQAQRRSDAVRKDKTGILAEHLKRSSGKDLKNSGGFVSALLGNAKNASHNLANYMLIISEQTVKEAKVTGGCDMHKYSDRQRFMSQAYAVIVCVTDPMFNRVTMYYSGIEDGATFPYDAFKHSGKGGASDPMDLVRAMQMIQQGQVPRF